MSKNSLLALLIILVIPLIFYTVTDYKSRGAVDMPHRYFADSVVSTIDKGKLITDTIWHRTADINLVNQLGNHVSFREIRGKVIVADYFFTHCPNICPALTANMKKLQDAIKIRDDLKRIDTSFVQFLSFSVDPERDSVKVLKKYADKFGVNPDLWWLLTGPKKTIYDFALNELKLGIADGEGVDSNFIHSQKMVLLDRDHVVRGYYNGLDSAELKKLAQDIVFIMLEKNKQTPSALQALRPLLPMMAIVMLGTAAAVVYFSRRKPSAG